MSAEEQAEQAERDSRAALVRRLDQIARGEEVLVEDMFVPVAQEPPLVKRARRK